ncbi:MAG: GNAT family N-acetyltransferase [Halioglobus sp.]
MNIEVYDKEITSELMALLLSADPDKKAVLSYLPGSEVLVCRDNHVFVGIAVLVETAGVFELKNIAVLKAYQGKGVAKAMISKIKQLAKELGAKVLEVGTGNSSLSQLALYQKCGFRMHRIESGFFDSYPEPIFENGIHCIDMVRLRAEL